MMISSSLIALGLGAFVYTGAGCLSPSVLTSDASRVTLEYGPWDDRDELQRMADSLCREYGKRAHLVEDVKKPDQPMFGRVSFQCVAQSA